MTPELKAVIEDIRRAEQQLAEDRRAERREGRWNHVAKFWDLIKCQDVLSAAVCRVDWEDLPTHFRQQISQLHRMVLKAADED